MTQKEKDISKKKKKKISPPGTRRRTGGRAHALPPQLPCPTPAGTEHWAAASPRPQHRPATATTHCSLSEKHNNH